MEKKKRIVIALGGNALGNTLPEQMKAVKITSRAIVGRALKQRDHRYSGSDYDHAGAR